MIKIPLSIIVLIITHKPLYAQQGFEWMTLVDGGDSTYDVFQDVYALNDGSFATVGSVNGARQFPFYGDFIKVAVVEDDGDIEWSHTYDQGQGCSVIEAENGDLVVGGVLGRSNFMACRLTRDGDIVWLRDYGAGGCNAVIELKEGAFVLAGHTTAVNPGVAQIIKIDGDGNPIWSGRYSDEINGFSTGFTGLRETDNGMIAAGYARLTAFEVKVDMNGNRRWSRQLPVNEEASNPLSSIISVRGGGFLMSGRVFGFNHEEISDQAILLKVTSNGIQQWMKRYNSNQQNEDHPVQRAMAVIQTQNNDFVLCGYNWGGNDGPDDALVIRTDSNGDERWRFLSEFDRMNGFQSGNVRFTSLVEAEDGGIVVVGNACREGTGYDAVVLKLESEEPGAALLYYLPEDTTLKVLPGDSIGFVLRAMNRQDQELSRDWFLGDSLITQGDTLKYVTFEDYREYVVRCHFWEEDWSNSIRWHVTVTDLYVSAFTPDTLDLGLRRGTSVDFSLDTIRYTDGAEPEILWTKTNLSNGQTEETGRDAGATIDFPWSGEYSVEGRVTRDESSDAVTWRVDVKGAIWAYVPVADSLEVLPDSVVHFEVVPSAPEDESLEVLWLVDGELVREGELALDWAFSTVDNCRRYLVQCVVADSVEADTVEWVVTVNDLSVGSEIEVGNPGRVALLSVSPNPFNSTLTIRYQSVKSLQSVVNLSIYDIAGREVYSSIAPPHTGGKITPPTPPTIVGGEFRTLIWDASAASAGVYFVRLQAGSTVSTKKVVLMR